ncbi:hypothetical protein SJAG_06643, partial [Schizosaccharomyces japonicus yFS275]
LMVASEGYKQVQLSTAPTGVLTRYCLISLVLGFNYFVTTSEYRAYSVGRTVPSFHTSETQLPINKYCFEYRAYSVVRTVTKP